MPRIARANFGRLFLETIGTQVAVGTVLGASALPFEIQSRFTLENNAANGVQISAVFGLRGEELNRISGQRYDDELRGGNFAEPVEVTVNPRQFARILARAGGSHPSVRARWAHLLTVGNFSPTVHLDQLGWPVVSLNS